VLIYYIVINKLVHTNAITIVLIYYIMKLITIVVRVLQLIEK